MQESEAGAAAGLAVDRGAREARTARSSVTFFQ